MIGQITRCNVSMIKGLLLCALLIVLATRGSETKHIPPHLSLESIFEKQEMQVDAEELKTVSTCKYEVQPFELQHKHHRLMPKKLYHVICVNNKQPKSCRGNDDRYMCIQTYKDIQIPNLDPVRIYTGCVCANPIQNNTSIGNFQK